MERAKRGVFWLIDDMILAIPFEENSTIGVAKAGNNYNHRLLWEYVRPRKCNKPFDYYPRGRVELSRKGDPIIYMNSNIDTKYIPQIMKCFGITKTPRIHIDGSNHYKCHFDR